MKTRLGLVSNSSSTSFTVVITTPEDESSTAEMLRLALGTTVPDFPRPGLYSSFSGNLRDFRAAVRKELRELNKDISLLQERQAIRASVLEELEKDKELAGRVERLLSLVANMQTLTSHSAENALLMLRLFRTQPSRKVSLYPPGGSEEYTLSEAEKRVACLEEVLKSLKGLNGGLPVAKFTVDHYSATQVSKILALFQDKGWARIVEKEIT